jgi:CheY-like chemotaxis protein
LKYPSSKKDEKEVAMTAKPKRLLLLDDDYESMEELYNYLKDDLGLEVEFSANANLLQQLDRKKFDLLIVDLMIHQYSLNAQKEKILNIHYDDVRWDRTGLEFIRRFRAGEYTPSDRGTSTSVPIIVLSAVADSATDGDWGDILEKEHPVEKPFRLSELVGLINSLLQE